VAETIAQVDPRRIDPNPENPRLIFRSEELRALEESIDLQGILVPLTVYSEKDRFVLLDGERRWRCAIKLNLPTLPVIIQPKPDRLQNIMMMFAIHNARKDWDPLPTAYKLRDLEAEYVHSYGRSPTEIQLAELASISRGEVRRLRVLLSLPDEYHEELMAELDKPRHEQKLTVDIVLEATKGAASLRRRQVITPAEEEPLRRAVVRKFQSGVISNTVEPRQLARIARAVEREEVSPDAARTAVQRVIRDDKYSVAEAYHDSVEKFDFEHSTEQLAVRLENRLQEYLERDYEPSEGFRAVLERVSRAIRDLVRE
jgi:ParB/RepB/Spo0J family partition protein